MITFTPISASASSSSSSEPICYLLELDEARILLDMGQRDYRANAARHSWEYEGKVRELAPTLSLVLLSHSATTYLSLYPYARAHWGLKCPVYATQPTVEMGRVVCLAEAESWRAECAVTQDSKPSQDLSGNGSIPSQEVAENGGDETMGEESGHNSQKPLVGPFVPTVEEIHEAFDWIKAIRYNQPLHLGGDLSHLLLTPFPSGHSLGGSLFKLRSPTSGTLLYGVGINHTGERHLDGMVGGPGSGPSGYTDGVLRPDLLIIEAGRSQVVNAKRRDRESALLDLVNTTLEQQNKSLLLPCDASPRLLELLVLLDQHWSFKLTSHNRRPPSGQYGQQQQQQQQQNGLANWPYPLCLVSKTAMDMVSFARSLIEWMGGVVRDNSNEEEVVSSQRNQRGGAGGRRRRGGNAMGSEYGALDFRHVEFFNTPMDLLQKYPLMRPKLVLAVPPSMSHGPSRWLFTAMAGTPGNVILLTGQSEDGTLTRDLFNRWEEMQRDASKWGHGQIGTLEDLEGQLELEMNSKVPLSGVELEEHLEAERLQKEREVAQQAAKDRSRRMLEADDLDSDSDSDSGDEAAVEDGIIISSSRRDINTTGVSLGGEEERQMAFDIFVKGQQMRTGRSGGGGGGDLLQRFRMFPFIEKRGKKIDEYGEGLDIGQWVRKGREIAEEGETEEVREAKRRKVEEEEKAKVPPEPPSKFVVEVAQVDLKASVFFVDMEGLHDGQAIKTIVADLQPRRMILVRSSKESTQSLGDFLATIPAHTKDIYSPSTSETIRIGEQVASYSIMLGDTVTATLNTKWSKFEGYEVAMIDGKIAYSAGSTVPTVESAQAKLEPIKEIKPSSVEEPSTTSAPEQTTDMQGGEEDITIKEEVSTPIPEAKPPRISKALVLPSSLFVGDLRLAALKAKLASKSIPAEFAGEGVLLCGPGILLKEESKDLKGNNVIAVRKLDAGEIVVEGNLGKTYFDVRRELYGGLAQVAGA